MHSLYGLRKTEVVTVTTTAHCSPPVVGVPMYPLMCVVRTVRGEFVVLGLSGDDI